MGDDSIEVDFVAVGPQRTGTTWLYEVLQQHSALYLPEAVKETMFFDRHYGRGVDWYASYFEGSREGQLCGEIAPTYFDDPDVPQRIYQLAPNCDIIISLRHPAERAFSLFIHHLRKGRVPRDFWLAIEQKPKVVNAGRYAAHIPRWQSTFGQDQVHILFLEDIRSDPQVVINDVCDWLDVESFSQPDRANEKVNAASMPKSRWFARGASSLTTLLHSCGLHRVVEVGKKFGLRELVYTGGEEDMPELSAEDRKQLIQIYEEDIAFVEKRTGRDLSAWRK
jgi:hypothetical protein